MAITDRQFNACLALLTRPARVAQKRSHDPELRRTIKCLRLESQRIENTPFNHFRNSGCLRKERCVLCSTEGNKLNTIVTLSFFVLIGLLRLRGDSFVETGLG